MLILDTNILVATDLLKSFVKIKVTYSHKHQYHLNFHNNSMQFVLLYEHWKYTQILERQMIQRFSNGKENKSTHDRYKRRAYVVVMKI